MESNSARDYNKWARECAENLDAASKKIFEELVGDEEMHSAPSTNSRNTFANSARLSQPSSSFGKEAPASVGA